MKFHTLFRRRGFTLIELLVVIAVLAVVSSIGMRAFFMVSDGWRQQTLRVALGERATAALASLQQDLALVCSARLGGVPIAGQSRLEETKRYGRVPLEDDVIILPAQIRATPDGAPLRQQVSYQIDRSGATPKLIRRVAPLGSAAGEGAALEVADGVLAIRFDYFDGSAWQRTWNAPTHPKAVRVGLVLQDLDRTYEQTARTAVFAIPVE